MLLKKVRFYEKYCIKYSNIPIQIKYKAEPMIMVRKSCKFFGGEPEHRIL